MSDVFLGEPSQNIKDWIIENTPYWTKFGIWLKGFNTSKLPQVGSYVTVPYKVDPEGEAVNTEWQILGYNKSIPSRIRYVNGFNEIFVPTMNGAILSAIGSGTPVYSGKETVDTIGTLDDVSEEIKVNPGNEINGVGHTYGNNNPYDAPESVNFNGKDWNFAGYNATIMSKCGVVAKYDNTLYVSSQFNSNEHNDWSASQMRTWMNGSSAVEGQKWFPTIGSTTIGTITGLLSRLPDERFLKAVSLCVNRTWVNNSWVSGKTLDSNQCEHVVDKFWLLGEGNINTAYEYTKDDAYDTSKFTGVFTSDKNSVRIRKYMKEDGSEGAACHWWFRSACSYGGKVGRVYDYGAINNDGAQSNNACLPACLIG